MAPIDLVEMIQEVRRELRQRHRLYPKWVAARQLNPKLADRQLAVLEKVQDTLLELQADPTQLPHLLRERVSARWS